ncbi:TAXI family TRAP transporter solute-binding subunit [Arthrobacter flavus]|uniref:TAXI family TRAP transporter solute-binding subunit n=1 Tax=Arthrobacter flavus TaxID=95172 RepID=A0ABW4QBE3_9MICC
MPDKRSWGKPAIDPMNLRSMLMLDVAREMMISDTWTHKAVSVSMSNPENPEDAAVSFLGVNDPDGIVDVADGRLDIATLNPVVMLNMARLGTGPFPSPLDLATIAVIPHYDQLAFAVANRLGFESLADIAEAKYPLRVSVRGSLDVVTAMSIDVVLSTYGFSLADIVAWGGTVFYDQPMPNHPTRIGRLENGEIDAIFEEGTIIWANDVIAAGASILPIDNDHLATLIALGFRRGILDKATYPTLPGDIQTLDYSGWPIYCRIDASDKLVRQFCAGLERAKDRIVWQIGPENQPPLPLEQMTTDSPASPFDVPLHPAARAYWQEIGYPVKP